MGHIQHAQQQHMLGEALWREAIILINTLLGVGIRVNGYLPQNLDT